MGNSLIVTEEKTACDIVYHDLEDAEEEKEDKKPAVNLSHLFSDDTTLRDTAFKNEPEFCRDEILQKYPTILKGLNIKLGRDERTITQTQFADFCIGCGVKQDEILKLVKKFDFEGTGLIDLMLVFDVIKYYIGMKWRELRMALIIFQSCSLAPCLIDVYGGGKPVEKHGARLLKYLLQNRLDISTLPIPVLHRFDNHFIMRSSVIKSVLKTRREVALEDYEGESEGDDQEREITDDCIVSIETSANQDTAKLLRSTTAFWNSSKTTESVWIRLHIKDNIHVKLLSLVVNVVNMVDRTLMPDVATVSVGHSPTKLMHVREVKMRVMARNQLVLLRNLKEHYPYIQIDFQRTQSKGKALKINHLKVIGSKPVKEQGMALMDTTAVWCLQMLTSVVNMSTPQSTAMRNTWLGYAKNAVKSMPPLSLSPSSKKPELLSETVLQELGALTEQLINSTDAASGLHLMLSLNLARGSVAHIVKFLKKLVDLPRLTLSCADLLAKTFAARDTCLQKLSVRIPVTFLLSDGGSGSGGMTPKEVADPTPAIGENVKQTGKPKVYLIDEGKTSCTMLFLTEENIQLTKMRIHVSAENKGLKQGLIFVYNPETIPELNSSPVKPKHHLDYFSKYDSWTENDFQSSIKDRKANLVGKPDSPVASFSIDNNMDAFNVLPSRTAVGKYILVKFLKQESDPVKRFGIMSIKFFGLNKNDPFENNDQNSFLALEPTIEPSCELPEVFHAVLTFLKDVATEQMKRQRKLFKPEFEFLDVSNLDLTDLWDLHLACLIRMKDEDTPSESFDLWTHSSILALQLIHCLIPALATSKVTTKTQRQTLFKQLCHIVDTEDSDSVDESAFLISRVRAIKQIIIDGAALFFHDKIKKGIEVLGLLKSSSDQASMSSTVLFLSLCKFFSSEDPSSVLKLPNNSTDDFSPAATLNAMKSLLHMAYVGAMEALQSKKVKFKMNEKSRRVSFHENSLPVPNTTSEPKCGIDAKAPLPALDGNRSQEINSKPKSLAGQVIKEEIYPGRTSLSFLQSKDPVEETLEALRKARDSAREMRESLQELDETPLCDGHIKTQAESDEFMKVSTPSATAEKVPQQEETHSSVGSPQAVKTSRDSQEDVSKPMKPMKEGLQNVDNLTASLQEALFIWCWLQLETKSAEKDKRFLSLVNEMVRDYTQEAFHKACQILDVLKTLTLEDVAGIADALSFLNLIVRQLVFLLTTLVDKLNTETKADILRNMKNLAVTVCEFLNSNPDLSTLVPPDDWTEEPLEVLKEWTMESPHPYENNTDLEVTLYCPGATTITLEFDNNCKTEEGYDFIEFADGRGKILRVHGKVGEGSWKKKYDLAGPFLIFHFHSDDVDVDWGYKFEVKAKRPQCSPNTGLTDLQLGLMKTLGQLAGATLCSNPIFSQENADDESEKAMLCSELWTSLFRGGYTVRKMQRSLSGKFATDDNADVNSFLLEVVDVVKRKLKQDEETDDNGLRNQALSFLNKCKESCRRKGLFEFGGNKVNTAIISLFVALIWHTQQLKEDLDTYLKSTDQATVSEGISQAYASAESLRIQIANARQKWNATEDKDELADPAEIFTAKAMILLKFASLTKSKVVHELRSRYSKQVMMVKSGNNTLENEFVDKHPSFRLVIEFVRDPAWTAARVHRMLQDRTMFASAISSVYMCATEVMEVMKNEDIFQAPQVLFFREMFSYQEKFAKHYAEGLDGCGLEQESKIRRAYYTLVRKFVDAFRNVAGKEIAIKDVPAHEFLITCLLHLLDVDWKPYDLSFIRDIQLPELLLNIAKESLVRTRRKSPDASEERELALYDMTMKWLSKGKPSSSLPKLVNLFLFIVTFEGDNAKKWFPSVEDLEVFSHMVVARFSPIMTQNYVCDQCNISLDNEWYRCLQCTDMDLCPLCYFTGVRLEEHPQSHEMVHLKFRCQHCKAFIVGHRIHCNQCDDFDLCLGCHVKQKFPSRHTAEHDVTKFPPEALICSPSFLKPYNQRHAWLLYSSLTLTLSEMVYGGDSVGPRTDSDYIKIAAFLQEQCITQASSCTKLVVEKNSGKLQFLSMEEEKKLQLALCSLDKILGLFGAVMVIAEKKAQATGAGCTEDFLKHLLNATMKAHACEPVLQYGALRLLARLLVFYDSDLADKAILSILGVEKETRVSGQHVIGHIISYGKLLFEEANHELACAVARALEILYNASQWQPAIQYHFSQCIQSLEKNPSQASIFPMLAMAGYPKMLILATAVDHGNNSSSIVLKFEPISLRRDALNLETRKLNRVKKKDLTYDVTTESMLDTANVTKLTSIVMDNLSRIQAGEELASENLITTFCAMKALNDCFNNSSSMEALTDKIFTVELIQSLVSLACRDSGVESEWVIKDLEELSIIWYTHGRHLKKKNPDHKDGRKPTAMNESREKSHQQGDHQDQNTRIINESTENAHRQEESGAKIGDDEKVDDGENTNKRNSMADKLEEAESPDDDEKIKGDDTDDDENNSETSEPKDTEDSDDDSDDDSDNSVNDVVDTDSDSDSEPEDEWEHKVLKDGDDIHDQCDGKNAQLNRLQRLAENFDALAKKDSEATNHENKDNIPDSAVSEDYESPQNLFKQQATLAKGIREIMVKKSFYLRKGQLRKHGMSGSSESLYKVNMALCILYARYTLTGLLAHWPKTGPHITSSLLGFDDEKQILHLLDLLYKADDRNRFVKIVDNVIHQCDTTSLVTIGSAAAHQMENICLQSYTYETSHNYTESDKKKLHIQFSGAPYLTVTFDSKCSISPHDVLMFYTGQWKNVHTFSGTSTAEWASFHVPGDSVYIRFEVKGKEVGRWGFKFVVTSGLRASFEIGHMILEAILSSSVVRSFPVDQLWSRMVLLSCSQSGIPRLRAISLMLKIVALQRRCVGGESKGTSDIDLKLLRPLWDLYEKMTLEIEDPEATHVPIKPVVVRALTDLFLNAENLATELTLTEQYIGWMMPSDADHSADEVTCH